MDVMSIFIRKNKKMTLRTPSLNILIGLPGSGKTTYAKSMFADAVYLSSDDIRVELWGTESQKDNNKVFQIMHKRCKEALKERKDVVFDATNLSKKRRMGLFKELKDYDVEINAYLFCAPIDFILENNLTRTERFIEYEKLINFIRTIDVPMYYEGYKNIYLINTNLKNDIYNKEWFFAKANSYNQGHPNHNQTLGGHTRTVMTEVAKARDRLLGIDSWIIEQAALYHDMGKLYTRVYNEKKNYYNYYNHEKVSAYLWCCHIVQHNIVDDANRYRLNDSNYQVAALIAHHMDFYKANLDDTKKLFNDDDLFDMLYIFNAADKTRRE